MTKSKINLRFVLVLTGAILLLSSAASATTYYVSSAGADTNNGTAKTTPWAHAPGMRGCSSTCAATNPVAGDQIILRGGDTWGNANFVWYWSWSGSVGNSIYIGVDQMWFSGGSWTRPILTAAGALTTTPPAHAFAVNQILSLDNSVSNLTVDNLEFTGGYCSASAPSSYGNNAIGAGNATNVLLESIYFHGWTEASPAASACWINLLGTTGATYNQGSVLINSVMDGSDAIIPNGASCQYASPCSGTGIYQWPTVRQSVFRYMCDGELTGGGVGYVQETSNSLFEYINRCWDLGHDNGYENNGGTAIFYNNMLRHITTAVKVWFQPCFGGQDAYYNNVLYDVTATNVWDITNQAPCPNSAGASVLMYNNTLDQPGLLIYPNNTLGSITVENTHCITSQASCFSATYGNMTTSNNLVQTEATANGQGYTTSNQYTSSAGGSTIGAGTNLTSLCAGSLAALCSDTTWACRYNSTNHTVSCPARTAANRPRSGVWDIGASVARAAPPTGVTITIQ